MTASDSNILVRLFANDDPRQTALAAALLADVAADGERLFVSNVVLCETVWTLARTYRFRRERIGVVIDDLLASDVLMVEDSDDVSAALAAFRAGRGDFADYLIRERARRAGALPVATFDETVMHEDGFAGPSKWRRRRRDADGVSERPAPRYGRRRARRRRDDA